jgi:hypothetical protein
MDSTGLLSAIGSIASTVGLVITVVIWRWSRRISKEQDALARAVAHLQVQEKNGVMRSNADWLAAGGTDSPDYRLECMVQDSLSVLRMLRYAPRDLLEGYFVSLEAVINNLESAHGKSFATHRGARHVVDARPHLKQLAQELDRWANPIEDESFGPPAKDEWVKKRLWQEVGGIRNRLEKLDGR